MERQKPSTHVKHNDAYSEALMDSYTPVGWVAKDSKVHTQEASCYPAKKELATPTRAGGADASTSIPDLLVKKTSE